MNIQNAKEQIKDTVEAYLKTDSAGLFVIEPVHQRPIFLLGAPGIGKTAIMEQIAQELGIGIVSYSMTHHTRQSALGLPRIEHHNFEGYEYEASEYTMSEIIGAIYDYMIATDLRSGILFLDEINCVSETLYPSMLQFLQFKTFGKHRVPDGWVVVCAGNPPEYNKQVHEFDIVTLDRMREIDVEPDYAAFKSYAAKEGLHPAVTTFLDNKKDCFYKVESKPGGGKAFVTTRGWEDLAHVISLYEELGKPVNRELFVQFLRDDEIADQFAVYYSLFEKYRSDYQVQSILDGQAPGNIKARAQAAEFDERVALLGLILDALSSDCEEVLELEGVALELRNVLKSLKDEFQQSAETRTLLTPVIEKREAALKRRENSGTMTQAAIRKERLVIDALRNFIAQCELEKTLSGSEAFHTIERAYKEIASKVKPAVEATDARITNAFAFVSECFSSREMLIFVADLATRKSTTAFLARYGNEAYFANNEQLQVESNLMGLEERAALLASLGGNIESARGPADNSMTDFTSVDMSGAVGIKCDNSNVSDDLLKKYYESMKFEYGFASVCQMHLPADKLKGKSILDIGCRRGRGVYKLSGMVGNDGFAMGTDWVKEYVEEGKAGIDRAWHDSGLSKNNMEIRFAYPEDLLAASIGSGSFDYVYLNNAINLFYSQAQTISEIARVLKKDGTLILETVFASKERPANFIEEAKKLGNSIQASLTKDELESILDESNLKVNAIHDEYDLTRDRGYKADEHVAFVAGDEDVSYKSVTLEITRS